MALAFKLQTSDRRVFTLIGDGESNEGSVWEAVMVANNVRLTNLTIMYDNNGSQQRSMPIPNPADRFRAFGCQVIKVNGHKVDDLKQAIAQPSTGVKVVVADTVKGYGCKTLVENVFEWHRKSPNDAQYEMLLRELDAEAI
jgi:transketolase